MEDAESYFYSGRKEDAFAFALHAIETATAENNLRKLSNAEFQMGNLLFLNGDFVSAPLFLENSLATKGEAISTIDHITTLDLLHQSYEKSGNYKRAYYSLSKKTALEAELRDLKIGQLQTELEQRESELRAIRAQMSL